MFGSVFILEIEEQLLCLFLPLAVQTVESPSVGALKDRLFAVAIANHKVAGLAHHFLYLWLVEQCAVQIVDMLRQQMDADASSAHIGEYLQYLSFVHLFFLRRGGVEE